MFRDLHTLRLVLPGTPRFTATAGSRSVAYVWPCDCSAGGLDDGALEVRCCAVHADLLASPTSTRGALNGGS